MARPREGRRWERVAPGHYRDTVSDAEIRRDGRVWRRTGGGAQCRGWYPSLQTAQDGRSGRRIWRDVTSLRSNRIDGWAVVSSARKGAPRCWFVYDPQGEVWRPPGHRTGVFGSRLAAQRATPRLSGGDRGGPRHPGRRTPDKASRAAETTATALHRAYLALATRRRDWVRLAEIRPRVRAPRHEVDRTLLELYERGTINLTADDNSKAVTAQDRAAAMRLGTDDIHLVMWRP